MPYIGFCASSPVLFRPRLGTGLSLALRYHLHIILASDSILFPQSPTLDPSQADKTGFQMALNGPGLALRRATDEGEDVADFRNNRLQEGWKEWPNEAGVSISPVFDFPRLHYLLV